jgi:hypothetical protein
VTSIDFLEKESSPLALRAVLTLFTREEDRGQNVASQLVFIFKIAALEKKGTVE